MDLAGLAPQATRSNTLFYDDEGVLVGSPYQATEVSVQDLLDNAQQFDTVNTSIAYLRYPIRHVEIQVWRAN